jgi:hypothetical protein
MSICIYSYPIGDLFNGYTCDDRKLVAIAPDEMRDELELLISAKNAEAKEARVNRRFGYDLETVHICAPGQPLYF